MKIMPCKVLYMNNSSFFNFKGQCSKDAPSNRHIYRASKQSRIEHLDFKRLIEANSSGNFMNVSLKFQKLNTSKNFVTRYTKSK